jgi:hypothetical protein
MRRDSTLPLPQFLSLAPPLGISHRLRYRQKWLAYEDTTMANEPCGPTPPANETVKPGTRMVHCVKFDRDLPGLDRPPWKGELGKRVYESVSRCLEALDRALQNGDERIPPQSTRSRLTKNHGRTNGAILLRRRRQTPRRLRSPESQRLIIPRRGAAPLRPFSAKLFPSSGAACCARLPLRASADSASLRYLCRFFCRSLASQKRVTTSRPARSPDAPQPISPESQISIPHVPPATPSPPRPLFPLEQIKILSNSTLPAKPQCNHANAP